MDDFLLIPLIGVSGYLVYRYLTKNVAVPATPVPLPVPNTNPTTVDGLKQLATSIAAKYGIPPGLFRALVGQESAWKVNAVSRAGAQGLTQLMPATAAGLRVTNPFDPLQNLDAGARYLAAQFKTFGAWPLALAAYNAGPGNVQKYHGIPPFAETQKYVAAIMLKQWIS